MSRAKLFNMIKSRGEQKVGRNPFDLTNRHVYTSKVGKITPVKAIHTYPEDYFEIDMTEFSQNNIPMNTAAFLSGKKEMLAYFIPYNTVWHNYNQYQATREDPESTLLKEKGISFEPRLRLSDMYCAALYFYNIEWLFKSYIDVLIVRLLTTGNTVLVGGVTHYSYRDLELETGLTGAEILQRAKDYVVNRMTGATWYDYGFNYIYTLMKEDYMFSDFGGEDTSDYLLGVPFACYEHDVLHDADLTLFDVGTNMQGNFIWCDWVQKMDMLGYSNIYPILAEYKRTMEVEVDDLLRNSVLRLFDVSTPADSAFALAGDNDDDILSDDYDPKKTPVIPHLYHFTEDVYDRLQEISNYSGEDGLLHHEFVNAYAIYAYNKCFYDYMRNTYFDNNYSVYNYNCDFINGNSLAGSIIERPYIPLRWYHIETHQWKKDMFTGVLPDNQFGQVSELILKGTSTGTITGSATLNASTGYDYGRWYMNEGHDLATGPAVTTGSFKSLISKDSNNVDQPLFHTHLVTGAASMSAPASFDAETKLNVIALKRAEAIQEYRQDLMRAGNRTKDIFKQIYGADPKSTLDECPYFIEVKDNDINVNPIISTAQTGQELNGKLGDIAARSIISGDSLSFKFSTKDFGIILFLSYIIPESFYNSYRLDPCVCHLDQEAHGLPYFQNLGLQPVIGSYLSNMHSASVRQRTHGFVPPYIERKTDVDLVHGNLVDLSMVNSDGLIDTDFQGSMSHWVVARTDMQSEETVSLRNFYINPRIVDNVFTFNAGDDYETDHFLTYCSIQVNAVRAFSEIGLPRF